MISLPAHPARRHYVFYRPSDYAAELIFIRQGFEKDHSLPKDGVLYLHSNEWSMIPVNGHLQAWQQDVEKWKTDLAFCREEIRILQRYLEDVSERPLSPEMREDIAHFHGRLTDTSQKAVTMIEEITGYGRQLHDLPFDEAMTASYTLNREKKNTFCQSYAGLKSAFVKFLAKSDIML